jgi:GTP cyclohydrolase I
MFDMQNQTGDPSTSARPTSAIAALRSPIAVLDLKLEGQSTVASLNMCVALPHQLKATHMSRFVEVLNEHRGEVTMRTMPALLTT